MSEYRVPSLNRVIIIGNLTKDPDIHYTPEGKGVCNFQIASSYKYLNKDNKWVDKPPTYIRIVTWEKLAERLSESLVKGHAVLVEGRLQANSWETPEGEKKSTIEIVANRVSKLNKETGDVAKPQIEPEPELKPKEEIQPTKKASEDGFPL